MARAALKTLFYPFLTGDAALPDAAARVLFLNGEPGFNLPDGFAARISAIQGVRRHFLGLEAAGYDVAAQPDGEDRFDAALVLCGRHRGQNEAWISRAVERVAKGGLILVAGGKDDGIASLRKRIGAAVELDGHLPKYHGEAFWFKRPANATDALAILDGERRGSRVDGRFETAPGMFSHDRIDTGSRLLVEHLPVDLSGSVADFCAGWGYIAAEIAANCPKVKALDLYETDFESLQASKRNMEKIAGGRPCGFFWQDLLLEPVRGSYDAIVMNPPFHQGRAAEPDIGRQMIGAAAKALRRGGRLFMVANRQLPYEAELAQRFSTVREAARRDGFKVLAAIR